LDIGLLSVHGLLSCYHECRQFSSRTYFAVARWQSEERLKILRCCFPDLLSWHPAQLSDLPRHFFYKRRFIALATMRHRSEERRIGLDEHALERHFFRGLADLRGLRIGHISGERDHEAQVKPGVHVGQ